MQRTRLPTFHNGVKLKKPRRSRVPDNDCQDIVHKIRRGALKALSDYDSGGSSSICQSPGTTNYVEREQTHDYSSDCSSVIVPIKKVKNCVVASENSDSDDDFSENLSSHRKVLKALSDYETGDSNERNTSISVRDKRARRFKLNSTSTGNHVESESDTEGKIIQANPSNSKRQQPLDSDSDLQSQVSQPSPKKQRIYNHGSDEFDLDEPQSSSGTVVSNTTTDAMEENNMPTTSFNSNTSSSQLNMNSGKFLVRNFANKRTSSNIEDSDSSDASVQPISLSRVRRGKINAHCRSNNSKLKRHKSRPSHRLLKRPRIISSESDDSDVSSNEASKKANSISSNVLHIRNKNKNRKTHTNSRIHNNSNCMVSSDEQSSQRFQSSSSDNGQPSDRSIDNISSRPSEHIYKNSKSKISKRFQKSVNLANSGQKNTTSDSEELSSGDSSKDSFDEVSSRRVTRSFSSTNHQQPNNTGGGYISSSDDSSSEESVAELPDYRVTRIFSSTNHQQLNNTGDGNTSSSDNSSEDSVEELASPRVTRSSSSVNNQQPSSSSNHFSRQSEDIHESEDTIHSEITRFTRSSNAARQDRSENFLEIFNRWLTRSGVVSVDIPQSNNQNRSWRLIPNFNQVQDLASSSIFRQHFSRFSRPSGDRREVSQNNNYNSNQTVQNGNSDDSSSDGDIRPRSSRHRLRRVVTSDSSEDVATTARRRGNIRTIPESDNDLEQSPVKAKSVDRADGNESTDSDKESEKCSICFAKFRLQEVGCPESCDHSFCAVCIIEWAKNNNTCPIDRKLFNSLTIRRHFQGEVDREIPIENPELNFNQILEDEEIFIVEGENNDVVIHFSDGFINTRLSLSDDENPEEICRICHMDSVDGNLIACDLCNHAFHLRCLTPPMNYIPVGPWYCSNCQELEAFSNSSDSD